MKTVRHVDAKCPSCSKPLRVQVGLKSTARTVCCHECGTGYSYSCWVIKKTDDRQFTQVEFVEISRRAKGSAK